MFGLKTFEIFICFQKIILRIYNSIVKSWITKAMENTIFRKEINILADIKCYQFTIELIKSDEKYHADKFSRYGNIQVS